MELINGGMQKTELGEVPADWTVGTFGDFMDGFSSGMTPYRGNKEFYTGSFPWITSGELNYNVITDTNEKITEDAIHKTNLKIIPPGTFLMAVTGMEAEGTRGSCAITGIPATTNQSCMALYPQEDILITGFLYHYYVLRGKELALRYSQGTKQQSYNAVTAKKLPIAFPKSKDEQRLIVDTLHDIDKLIESIEKLIEKKRLLKTGTMQIMLCPKGDWIMESLSEFIKFQCGWPFSSKKFNQNMNGFRLVKNRDLRSDDSIFYFDGEFPKEFIVNNGDLLIGMDGDFEPIIWKKGIALLNQRVGRILKIKDINLTFLSYKLIDELKAIENRTGSTTVKHLSHFDVENIECLLPSKDEQDVIANTLSSIDNEIDSLSRKLKKFEKIRAGVMRQLLCGRIRLKLTNIMA